MYSGRQRGRPSLNSCSARYMPHSASTRAAPSTLSRTSPALPRGPLPPGAARLGGSTAGGGTLEYQARASLAGRRPNNMTALPEASASVRSRRAGTRYAQCALTTGGRWREHITVTEPVLRRMRTRPVACTAPGRILAAARNRACVAAACAGLSGVLLPARALHSDGISQGASTACTHSARSASAAMHSARPRRTDTRDMRARAALAPGGIRRGRAAHLCDLRKRAAQRPPQGRPVCSWGATPCRITHQRALSGVRALTAAALTAAALLA